MFGKLTGINGNDLTIHLDESADVYRIQKYANGKQPVIELNVNDSRHITADQRKKIFAMFNDISKYTGYEPNETEQTMKYEFIAKTGYPYFSFSDCSEELATRFIKFLIWFCLGFKIPFRSRTWDILEDSYYAQLQALENRMCIIDGKPNSDIHHLVHAVGMGRNRQKIANEKSYFTCLCRQHHNEIHMNPLAFMKKYHIKPIKLTSEQIKKLHIGGVGNEH